ncbi:MAG: cell division protein FtsK, partial [Alphaproteobacteria bacterium]|nr:cell division protein FtsK [Alphaproteobacteria bacterium]
MAHAATGWLQSSFGPLGALLANGLLALTSALVLLGALGFAPAEWRRAAFATADATAHVARAGAARRHFFWRAFSALGRFTLWLFGRGRGRGVKPGADLSSLLRAADEAAERVPERREPALAFAAAKPSPRVATPAARSAEKPRQATLDLQPIEGGITIPPLELLQAAPPRTSSGPDSAALQANARRLEQVLADFGVSGEITEIRPGPVVTLYELEPAPGVKSSRVIGLADDIARNMSVVAVRIATVPGRTVMGIELPNAKRETVYFSEMMGSEAWAKNTARLPLALGKNIGGEPVVTDLARMPHLLIAGTTGSGKSVGINTMILSLLYRFGPEECRFIMIDPKMLELSVYDRIPHLLAPVVTEPPKAIGALKWTVREMEKRYRAMSSIGVRNIAGYNEKVEAARARGEVLTRRVQTGFDPET